MPAKIDLNPQILQLRGKHNDYSTNIAEALRRIQVGLDQIDRDLTSINFRESTATAQDTYWRILIDPRETIALGTDLSANHARIDLPIGKRFLLEMCVPCAKIIPTGNDLIADFLVTSDDGGNWDSIFPAGNANKIRLLDGTKSRVITTFAPSFLILNPGNMLRYDVLQVGSTVAGGGLEIALIGKVI